MMMTRRGLAGLLGLQALLLVSSLFGLVNGKTCLYLETVASTKPFRSIKTIDLRLVATKLLGFAGTIANTTSHCSILPQVQRRHADGQWAEVALSMFP